MSEVDAVLRALTEKGDEAGPLVLATIVASRGSTPRKEGARMVVSSDGQVLAGTVGGGCGEGEVLEAARQVFQDGRGRMVRVDLTEELFTLSPAICGGVMEVWVERVGP
jgi:xanthine/CO dehydrogenase XdhC/CoxF family maturation factor